MVRESAMATIPELEARIHALRTKGRARTTEGSVGPGQRLTERKTHMPAGDFYRHVLEVLRLSARTAQRYTQRYREHPGRGRRTPPQASLHKHICASDTSPGHGTCPPPFRPASDMVWCGTRHGRVVTSAVRAPVRPATRPLQGEVSMVPGRLGHLSP
jgi:hypothetical protein